MSASYKPFRVLAIAGAMALLVSACGTETSSNTTGAAAPATEAAPATTMAMDMADDSMADDEDHEEGEAGHEEGEHTFTFGEPGDPADADRVIEIETLDTLRFSPDQFDIAVGEIVTFRVTNNGNLPHDFLLDDAAGQQVHDDEMAEMAAEGMMEMADEDNGFDLQAGETKELTWHFTEAGEVLIGCHQVGHYAAGMVATINVEA